MWLVGICLVLSLIIDLALAIVLTVYFARTVEYNPSSINYDQKVSTESFFSMTSPLTSLWTLGAAMAVAWALFLMLIYSIIFFKFITKQVRIAISVTVLILSIALPVLSGIGYGFINDSNIEFKNKENDETITISPYPEDLQSVFLASIILGSCTTFLSLVLLIKMINS